MSKKKIAILLPFKDHFTNSQAGSASIWIKDFNRKSKYKNYKLPLTEYLVNPVEISNAIDEENGI